MTNINCTLNCIYQIEGKCSYDIISNSNFNDMINEEALVATPNAAENNNAVATASVEQVNNTNKGLPL